MAYRDDISALGAQHHYDFDGDSTDQIGSVNGTNTGVVFTDSAIAEDATNCMTVNGLTDRVTLATTTDINNSAQTRKAVCGWFETTGFQAPPTRIYGEGSNTTCFQFAMGYGNQLVFECTEPTNFAEGLQVFGPALVPNRVYHICGIFLGNANGNEVKLFVDGIEQFLANPSDRQPDTASLDARGQAIFADPSGTVGLGGGVVLQQAARNGRYQHWATFDGAAAELTDTEVRETLFERGTLPGTTIAAGTEAAMQTALDALASTVRGNEPLNIRVSTVTGDGDLTLTADNITHDALASIHVQYMGTGTLTWVNDNGSDASIGSTPNGGTIVFAQNQTLTVTAIDNSTQAAISGARVYLEADTGGPLTAGTVIMNTTANGSGVATASFQYTGDQPVVGRVRKGSGTPYYKNTPIAATLTVTPLDLIALLVADE